MTTKPKTTTTKRKRSKPTSDAPFVLHNMPGLDARNDHADIRRRMGDTWIIESSGYCWVTADRAKALRRFGTAAKYLDIGRTGKLTELDSTGKELGPFEIPDAKASKAKSDPKPASAKPKPPADDSRAIDALLEALGPEPEGAAIIARRAKVAPDKAERLLKTDLFVRDLCKLHDGSPPRFSAA